MNQNLDLDVEDALLDITVTGNSVPTSAMPRDLAVTGLVGPAVPILFTNAKVALQDKNGEVIFFCCHFTPIKYFYG